MSKKILLLKFENSHFEPVINSQITTLLGHVYLPDFHRHNIFDELKSVKKKHSP